MKLPNSLFPIWAIGAPAFLSTMTAALDVERERELALTLGLTNDQFEEVLSLCSGFSEERAWDRETFIHSLHERVKIRGGMEQWHPRLWNVPHLMVLPLLDPDHQEDDA